MMLFDVSRRKRRAGLISDFINYNKTEFEIEEIPVSRREDGVL